MIYILGYSGHSYVVIDCLQSKDLHVKGYFDPKPSVKNPYNIQYMGDENSGDFLKIEKNAEVFPSVGNNILRGKMIKFLERNSISQKIVMHSSAKIATNVNIGLSTLIAPSAVINSTSQLGKGVIANTSSVIEHGCQIGNYVHIAPGAVLLGDVELGHYSFIGANSVVLGGIKIGTNSILGAGSVLLEDIPDNQTWVGNPAKRIK